MKEKKKYSPWVNILKKHDSEEDAEVSKDKEVKPLWSPPPVPIVKDEKEEVASEKDKDLLEKLGEVPDKREALYWKLHKEYYNAHLDILSDDDRRIVSEQPDSELGVKFHSKVKIEVDKAVDYQLTFLR